MNKIIILLTLVAAMFTSCTKEKSDEPQDPSKPEVETQNPLLKGVIEQFKKEFPNSINPTWSIVEDKYAVVQFSMPSTTQASASLEKEVWYNGIKENTIDLIKDNTKYEKDAILTIPTEVKDAFNTTTYADAAVWTVDEVELKKCKEKVEGAPDQLTQVYVYEVDNVADKNLEAKVIVDAGTFQVVFSKEYQNEDDKNVNDKETVIDQKIIDQINIYFMGQYPVILDAEIEGRNGYTEVEGSVTVHGEQRSFKAVFDKDYKMIAADYDHKTIFSKFDTPEDKDLINAWFDANVAENPVKPSDDTRVKVKRGMIIKDEVKYTKTFEFELVVDNKEVKYLLGINGASAMALIEKEIDD